MTGPGLERIVARLEAAARTRARGGARPADEESAWDHLAAYVRQRAQRLVAPGDIDDVVQTVLLKLQEPTALRRLRAARSFDGYLAVMTRNAFVNLLRARREREATVDIVEPADDGPSPPDLVADAERQRKLAEFTETLSAIDREFLQMRYWQDLSIAEIAARRGLNYSAVAVRLFRILARLRVLMGPDAPPWR